MKRRSGLLVILFAVAPKPLQRGLLVLVALLLAPLVFIALLEAVGKLLDLVPGLLTLGALFVLYVVGRRLFGR